MNCKQARRFIADRLWERAGSPVWAEWERHLAECAECRAEQETLQAADGRLKTSFQEDLPADFARIVLQKAQLQSRPRPRVAWWAAGAAIAASVLLVLSWRITSYIEQPLSRQAVLEGYEEDLQALSPGETAGTNSQTEIDYTDYGVPTSVAGLLL